MSWLKKKNHVFPHACRVVNTPNGTGECCVLISLSVHDVIAHYFYYILSLNAVSRSLNDDLYIHQMHVYEVYEEGKTKERYFCRQNV